jgi:hypothetical protein
MWIDHPLNLYVRVSPSTRLKFDTAAMLDTCTNGFVFAVHFVYYSLPEDVTFDILGASATFISEDRTMVTFEPDAAFANWNHDFWNTEVHGGTRLHVLGSDLSGFNGVNSVQNHVICQDFGSLGKRVSDLSCKVQPGVQGRFTFFGIFRVLIFGLFPNILQ